jgi:hypothetical protein
MAWEAADIPNQSMVAWLLGCICQEVVVKPRLLEVADSHTD